MSENFDAIVIGAGIIGACTAYELAKAGRRVAVVEMNPDSGYGSTSMSCAIIRTHYSTRDGAALALSNYPYWQNWPDYLGGVEDERGLSLYREVGCIYTCYEENNFGRKLVEIAEDLAIPFEIWTPETMKRRIPIISPGNYHPPKRPDDPAFGSSGGDMRYVIYFPRAGYISDPQLATHNVHRAAEAKGATFIFRERVGAIETEAGRTSGVRTESGRRLSAPVVVNCAGPHSYKVNDLAGVSGTMNIGTRALRVEVAHIPSPEGYDFETGGIIGSDADIGGYYRPEVGNHILVGSEEPPCDDLEWVDPDRYDTSLTEQARVQALRAAQRFPSMGIPNTVKGVVSLYDVADDWIPIYDKSDLPGFYMAVGTSGNQFKNGPVVGMLMASLIEYCEAGGDHDVAPLTFRLPNMDYGLCLSFCSRKREINRESSFSVVG